MILLAIAYFPTSTEGTTEFPLILRFSNENVKCVFVDCRQNISATKSKQTSSFLEIHNSNKSSFEYLLTYLSSLITGLLEMWLGLLTFILGLILFSFVLGYGSV